jgi:hypothetical protein
MKIFCTIIVISALSVILGCKRSDFRRHEFHIPGMTAVNTNRIVKALSKYDGVDLDSLKWNLQTKTLSIRFDSMKVAQTNIRMAIEKENIAVSYNKKTDNVAGYLNKRDTEVDCKRHYRNERCKNYSLLI